MAQLDLSYEECAALRRAAENVPARERSHHLASALNALRTVIAAIEQGRRKLAPDEDAP
jgi:hypothetical protein